MSAPTPAALPPASETRTALPQGRIDTLDMARGLALLAMAAYHAIWDLGFLRLTPENYALSPAGKAAAHGIAGSFLVLVGIGLVLANGQGVRSGPFLRRLARIGGAALLVTLATRFLFPDSYVFFGILHCIALSSVLALPFVFLPVAITVLAAAAVIAAPHLVHASWLDAPYLYVLGLGAGLPRTNDWVPLFPWFGMVLVGVALGRVGLPTLAGSSLASWRTRGPLGRTAAFAGRHSLAIYLVHQPLLLGLLAGLAALTGPHPRAGVAEFRREYQANCTRTGGEPEACRIAGRCTADALRREGLWSGGGFTPEQRVRAQGLSQTCYEAAEGTAPPP